MTKETKPTQELELVDDKSPIVLPDPVMEVTPMTMIQQAIQQGATVEQMERLWALNEKVEESKARKAYFAALAEFKQNPPEVVKDKLNKQYDSNYVSIGNMVKTVSEELGKVGLSTSWTFGEGDEGEIVCTCIMSHSLGHQESVTLSSPVDTSGAKNPLQGRKSTRTYLKLETFEAVTGMTSIEGNLDDDGNAFGKELIDADQVKEIKAKIKKHKVNESGFNDWLKSELECEKIEDVTVGSYGRVIQVLNKSIAAKKPKADENS